MPGFWDAKSRAYVVANPVPAVIWLYAGEKIKTCLKPVSETVSDFNGFMFRVFSRANAVDRAFTPVQREVGV